MKKVNKKLNKGYRVENGKGSIVFRSDRNSWQYQVSYIDENGKRKRKSFTSKDKSKAIAKGNAFLILMKAKVSPDLLDATIPDIIQIMADNDLADGIVHDTGYVRRLDVKKQIETIFLASKKIVDIKENDIRKYLNSITNYSDSVITKNYQQINKCYKYARQHDLVKENLIEKFQIHRPKSKKVKKIVKPYTEEEMKKFIEAVQNYKFKNGSLNYKNQLLLMLYTGMRMGEINALTINDIDITNKTIRIKNTITHDIDYKTTVGDKPKTESSIRTIKICDKALEIVTECLEEYISNDYNLIFYDHKNNKPIRTQNVNSSFTRICKKNNLPHYGEHMLRHTYATYCVTKGINFKVVQSWLGHKDIKITMNTYTKMSNELENNALDLLNRAITV